MKLKRAREGTESVPNNSVTLDSRLYQTAGSIMVARVRLAEGLNTRAPMALASTVHLLCSTKTALENIIADIDGLRLDLEMELDEQRAEGMVVMQEQERERTEAERPHLGGNQAFEDWVNRMGGR